MSDDEVEFLGEVTKTKRRNRPGPSRGTLTDRLIAMSREEMKECGEEPGVQSDSEPTEVEIINQERLPTRAQVETQRFQEPIKKWVAVQPSDKVPSWNRELLPEDEEEPDCDPPPPVRVDIGLVRYKKLLDKENIPTNTNPVLTRSMVLSGNFAEDEEVVVQEGDCIFRTTCGAIRRASLEQETEEEEEEEEEEEITVVESEDPRRRGEPRGRARSVSSSPGRDISDWTSLEPRGSRDHQEHRHRRDSGDREREDSHGGRYQRVSSDERRHSRQGRTDRERGPLEDDYRARESHRSSMEDRYYSRSDREERERAERGSSRHDRRSPTRVGRHSGSTTSRASSPRNFQEYNRERKSEGEKRKK